MIPSPIITQEEAQRGAQPFAQMIIHHASGQKSLHAQNFFDAGETLCSFTAASTVTTPSYLTVQTGTHQHITLQPEYLQYINHSCEPNVFFDTTSFHLIALKAIQPGDELTFFYPSTEWRMAQPFECYCGTASCLKNIQGAAFLTDTQLRHYKLTDFIQQQLINREV